ncbi:hypothetical protein K1T71_001536 [Dendrolimus kikuchii]|uniref:Uncharacterized protein n=1 Tax=Dendrolimus kikuchii TaxID=765133 RepID=A0ACC1DI75_9NEOP|nr:hypothetical protein K1T71_001536 [Dendrolimus kikuchii]
MSSKSADGGPPEEVSKVKVDLDTILIEEIGQFGKYQIRTLVFTLAAVIFSACQAEYVFTTARINSRCFIPECEVDPETAEFTPAWLPKAIPGNGDSFDNCQRYAVANYTLVGNDTCPEYLFDINNMVECEKYVYENHQTVAYDYNLACNEWRRTLIGFIRTCGTLFALPLTGYISDKWGRKTALTFNAVNAAWLGLLRYWAPSYFYFVLFEILESIFGAGVFSCTYILVLELVGPKYRVIAGAILSSSFATGQMFVGLVAWACPNWHSLTLALYIPQFITIAYWWILSESVRWYMSKGLYDKSEALLKEAARINGRELSHLSLEALRRTAEEEIKKRSLEASSGAQEPLLILQVFRKKRILVRCMVTPFLWITTTGNGYLNYVAVAAAELPGFWLSVFLMEKIGRKPVLIGGYWMCAACQVAYIYIPTENYAASLAVYLIGKSSISIVVIAIYVYTTELYPTKYRHNLFAFSSMIGRIGSITAPLTPALGAAIFDNFPFVLFAGFALLSGILLFLTPETLGTKLPDTMDQASDLGLKKNNT